MLRLASALFCVIAGAVLYAAVHVQVVADAELRVLEGFMGLPGHAYALDLVGMFDPAPFAVLSLSLVAGGLIARRPRAAAAAAATMLGAGVTTQVLKPLLAFQRDYPPDHFMGPVAYPSGHTTAVMSLALALIIVSPPRLRTLAAAAGGLLTVATVFSILVLGGALPERHRRRAAGGDRVGVRGDRGAAAGARAVAERRGAGRVRARGRRDLRGRAAAGRRVRLRGGQHDVRRRSAGDRRRRTRAQR